MPLSAGEQITYSDFINLKNRVKEEMKRRKYTGSLTAYAGSAYDYTTTPARGVSIAAEHQEKIVTPMRAINSTKLDSITTASSGNAVVSISNLDTILDGFESRSLAPGSSDCGVACSGLCHTGCGNTCSGCSGYCEDNCANSCYIDCSSSCSGGCSGLCQGSCKTCSENCNGNCYKQCANNCDQSCVGSCKTSCGNTVSKDVSEM